MNHYLIIYIAVHILQQELKVQYKCDTDDKSYNVMCKLVTSNFILT